MNVLFTEDLKGSDLCCAVACRHKGFPHQLTRAAPLKVVGAEITAGSAWIHCSCQDQPPPRAQPQREEIPLFPLQEEILIRI